jgi:hypothetical protein
LGLPAAVLPLVVLMIKPAFGSLLVSAIGLAQLPAPGLNAAGVTAVALAVITVGADKEDGMAFDAATKLMPQNHFAMRRHTYVQAGLDKSDEFVAG